MLLNKFSMLKIWCDEILGNFEEYDQIDMTQPGYEGVYYFRAGECYSSWNPWFILFLSKDKTCGIKGHNMISHADKLFFPNQPNQIIVNGIIELETNWQDLQKRQREELGVILGLANFAEHFHIETDEKCYLRFRVFQIIKRLYAK